MIRPTLRTAALSALIAALAAPQIAHAQAAAPITITPQTLRPAATGNSTAVTIPEAEGLTAPPGAEGLAVTPGTVSIDGAFPEMATANAAFTAALQSHRVTLTEIYAAASALEQAYARAGYVLARAAVPPQKLVDGGALRVLIVDGFVESVDVSGVPARVRRAVTARAAPLIGRRHLKLGAIEQPLLLAGQAPGLRLTSTLAHGTREGGVRMILAGQQQLISGSIGGDNNLAPSLGTYGVSAQIAVNGALGLGEQAYGFVASGWRLNRLVDGHSPERVLGGGVVLPLGDGRLTLNPEVTFARTQPLAVTGVPPSLGTLRRLTLRGDYVLRKTRRHSIDLTMVAEQIDEINTAIGLAQISHDRYAAARIGLNLLALGADGSSLYASLQLSHGLGGFGALQLTDLPTGSGFSRAGARLDFTRLTAQVNARAPLVAGWQLGITAKGQSSFGQPLFRTEQGALEGADAVSGFVGGVTAVDQALTLRGELSRPFALSGIQMAPYGFAAGGAGTIQRPSAVERSEVRAASLGGGLRAYLPRIGLSASIEYARNYASLATIDLAPLESGDRVNFTTSLRF